MDTKEAMALQDRIGQVLVAKGYITAEQLTRALAIVREEGKRLSAVLQEQGLSREKIIAALSSEFKIPIITNLGIISCDRKVVELISKADAIKYGVVPIHILGNDCVKIAVEDPTIDLDLINILKELTKKNEIMLVLAKDIKVGDKIKEVYPSG